MREKLITVLLFLAVVAGTFVTVVIGFEGYHVIRSIEARNEAVGACEVCVRYFEALEQQGRARQQQQQLQQKPQ